MTKIYTQLRVSCGLSAIINGLQPPELKIKPNETFAHWLDVQWLKLTKNNSDANPLVSLCYSREHQWVAVLDYILLRKIRSSFLLCKGISPASLTTEAAYEDLEWKTLMPDFARIIERLNKMEDDWPLWHYNGKLEDPKENLKDDSYRKKALKLVQKIKIFYEIYESNITIGLEADWKQAINNLGADFPEKVTAQAVYNHLDYYKTDFEIGGLLQTLGFEADHTYGMQYPSSVKPNALVLINRPGHWVVEDNKTPGNRKTVLDSLTAGTDSVRMGDTFNYYKPVNNLRFMKQILPELAKIFPDVEVEIADEGLTDFPPLQLPVTDNPVEESIKYNKSAIEKYSKGERKEGLLDKRIECALLEKTDKHTRTFNALIEFTRWCFDSEKYQTVEENLVKLTELEKDLDEEHMTDVIKFHKLLADIHCKNEDYDNAVDELQIAVDSATKDHVKIDDTELLYSLNNGLGVNNSRLKKYPDAIAAFKIAKKHAMEALEENGDITAEDPTGPPMKYWPAIVQGMQNKIAEVKSMIDGAGLEKVD